MCSCPVSTNSHHDGSFLSLITADTRHLLRPTTRNILFQTVTAFQHKARACAPSYPLWKIAAHSTARGAGLQDLQVVTVTAWGAMWCLLSARSLPRRVSGGRCGQSSASGCGSWSPFRALDASHGRRGGRYRSRQFAHRTWCKSGGRRPGYLEEFGRDSRSSLIEYNGSWTGVLRSAAFSSTASRSGSSHRFILLWQRDVRSTC